jgi:hypothetical protein
MVFSSQKKERRTTDKNTEKQNYQLYLPNKVLEEVEKEHVATQILPLLFLWPYFFGA